MSIRSVSSGESAHFEGSRIESNKVPCNSGVSSLTTLNQSCENSSGCSASFLEKIQNFFNNLIAYFKKLFCDCFQAEKTEIEEDDEPAEPKAKIKVVDIVDSTNKTTHSTFVITEIIYGTITYPPSPPSESDCYVLAIAWKNLIILPANLQKEFFTLIGEKYTSLEPKKCLLIDRQYANNFKEHFNVQDSPVECFSRVTLKKL